MTFERYLQKINLILFLSELPFQLTDSEIMDLRCNEHFCPIGSASIDLLFTVLNVRCIVDLCDQWPLVINRQLTKLNFFSFFVVDKGAINFLAIELARFTTPVLFGMLKIIY